jgi:hypothetical protein
LENAAERAQFVKLFVEKADPFIKPRLLGPGGKVREPTVASSRAVREINIAVPSGMGVIQRTLRHFDHLFPL